MQRTTMILLVFAAAFLMGACSNNNAATGPAGAGSSGTMDGVSGSGDDIYYEYTITSARKGLNMEGFSKLYVSSGGKLRSEMDLSNPAAKKDNLGAIVSIGSKDNPNQSISIDDDKKTYSLNIIDTSGTGDDPFKTVSTVTKVGEDRILGFNSVHARIISVKSMGPMGKMTDTIDLWNSSDVPMAPYFRHFMDKNMSKSWTSLMSSAAVDQLKQMGCTGFMTKMQTGSGGDGMRMELTKMEKRNFPSSMFEIPTGYKEEK